MESSSLYNHHLQRRASNDIHLPTSLTELALRSGYMGPESTETLYEISAENHNLLPHHLHSFSQTSLLYNPYPDPLLYHPRTLLPPHTHNTNEAAIAREIEKQKIREEIIASEIANRSALEDEIRRQLMIGRELARRNGDNSAGFSLTSSYLFSPLMLSPLLGSGNEGFAFLRGTEMSSSADKAVSNLVMEQEERVILQPKPGKTLVGSKRASSTPSRTDLNSQKKAKDDLSCALCQVTSTSKQALEEHLSGKKHKANEEAMRNNKASRNYTIGLFTKKASKAGSKPKPESSSSSSALKEIVEASKNESEKSKNEAEGVEKVRSDDNGDEDDGKERKYKYWCETCKVGTFSEAVMNDHRRGKKHLRQVQKTDRKHGDAVTDNEGKAE